MRLLLQNKISTLEKQNGLCKVSGDEKIAISVAAPLNNTKLECSSLATKFKLNEEFYYGGAFDLTSTTFVRSFIK